MKKNHNIDEEFNRKVERLIEISKKHPLMPDTYVPWDMELQHTDLLMPENLLSLHGTPELNLLSPRQQRELARAEIAQVMYSYGWSEGLACLFFFRYIVSLRDNVSPTYRYLLTEVYEECRHQQMFSMAVEKLGVTPIPPRLIHRVAAWCATRLQPADVMFMSVLAIELVTDVYGTELRTQRNIFPVLAKISQLHNIEEGRHIHFTQLLLEKYTKRAGVFRRSLYSVVVCLNIYFMRTMYVRKKIFRNIGADPKRFYRPAYRGIKKKFGKHCLDRAISFVEGFNGFNWFTRLVWKVFLGAKF